MKLGTQTGSLVNHIYTNVTAQIPPIGTGVTLCNWTDRSAGTVFAVHKGNIVEVRDDKITRTDSRGMSEMQTYSYKTDVNGTRRYFRLRNGKFEEVCEGRSGRWCKTFSGTKIALGVRDAFHDFSF